MSDMNIDLNDMYIEDADMSFEQLEDGFSDEQIEEASLGAEDVGAEDLVDDLEEYEDEEVEEEEVEEDEEEGEEVAEEEIIEEDDEEEVDFEEYDVTLPSGETIKLHEAIQGYRSAQELAAAKEAFEAEKQSYEQSNTAIKKMLDLAKLEADRVIEDYADFDWATLSREDPQAYVENREFLDKYKARRKEIAAEMDHIEQKLITEKQEAVRVKAAEANTILTRDIPGWNKEMYVDLMTYAVKELGMDEQMVTDSVDAGFFKAINMARQLAQGKQAVKAKIKRVNSSPKKVVKPAAKVVKPVNTKKAVVNKKLETGQYDESDIGDMFSMLED